MTFRWEMLMWRFDKIWGSLNGKMPLIFSGKSWSETMDLSELDRPNTCCRFPARFPLDQQTNAGIVAMVGNGGQCWWLGRWGPDVFSCSGLTKLLCENASEWSTQHGLIGMKTRLLDFCNVALETILPSKRNSGQTVPKIIPVTIWSVNLLELKGLAKKRSWPPQGMLRNGMFVDPICVESTIFSIFRCLGSVWRGIWAPVSHFPVPSRWYVWMFASLAMTSCVAVKAPIPMATAQTMPRHLATPMTTTGARGGGRNQSFGVSRRLRLLRKHHEEINSIKLGVIICYYYSLCIVLILMLLLLPLFPQVEQQ